MKGNKQTDFLNCVKRHWYIVAAVIVFIALLIYLMSQTGCCHSEDKPVANGDILPTIRFNGDNGYIPTPENKGMKLDVVSGYVFKPDVTDQDIGFTNYNSNKYAIKAFLYLADGTGIYESKYMLPGETIGAISLSKPLKAGIYKNALLVYRFYTTDDAHTAISQCEFPIEIQCK